MAEAVLDATAAPEVEPKARVRSRPRIWLVRIAKALIAIALVLALGLVAFLAFLDTEAGHRFIVNRIAAMTPPSGLKIRIGRIDGSIYGRTTLIDVRLYDPQGLFAEAPRIDMDWRPVDYVFGTLTLNEVDSELAILRRLPRLNPPAEARPILPDYDVHLGRLDVRQFRFGAAVAGRERVGRLHAEAQIRSGRALLALDLAMQGGGERLALRLDAEPDRDRFDLDARVDAPESSVVAALLGTRRPVRLELGGDGSWSRWTGAARLDISGRRSADLNLAMASGRFALRGWAAPAPFLRGRLQRLTAPHVRIAGNGLFAERRVTGRLSLLSGALRADARGTVDLAGARYEDVRIAALLTRPPAMFRNMTGRDVRLAALLDGGFNDARFVYRITSPHMQFDNNGFDEVRVAGAGHLSRAPVAIPMLASATRVTGVGEMAADILGHPRLEGTLQLTGARLTGPGLVFTSDKARGLVDGDGNLGTGQWVVLARGGMQNYFIPGFGTVDALTQLRIVPGPDGHGTFTTGTAQGWVRRLDNRFLSWVSGGLPRAETNLARGPDRIVHFSNLRVTSPKISFAGTGLRRTDATYSFEGNARHADYGPARLSLEGRLERPRLALRLDRPVDSLGLAGVVLTFEPSPAGYGWRAEGGSTLGPFTGTGTILLPPRRQAIIQVAALNVSGTRASGALRLDPHAFTGRLGVAGGGLDGELLFGPFNNRQRVAVDLAANDARFYGPPPIVIRRATISGIILLDPEGNSVEGRVAARGVSRGPLSIANVEASASLRGGVGRINARIAASRGRDFTFSAVADAAPGRYRVSGSGTLDRRALQLITPADLTWTPEGWRLAATRFSFAGGSASVSGLFGARTEVDAQLAAMPLTVLDIGWPQLGLGGIASGSVRYRSPHAGAPPSGEANLRVRGLTRAGLVLSSRPMDIGVNARLEGPNAALRAIAVSEGRVIGRAQARISAIGGPGLFVEQLARAPMQAQIRYNGPADTLWRLTGVELIDVSGPAAIAADVVGSLENPRINGSVRTVGARLESAVTGMVIENLQSFGRFGGSQLRIEQFQGTTAGGGRVAGAGVLDLAGDGGVGMRFNVRAQNARLLDRDDIAASVTGDLEIRSAGNGGTISGNVTMTQGRFRLGSATAMAQVPRLRVTEVNRPDAFERPVVVRIAPWRLAIAVAAPGRVAVNGLGMNSEWRANVQVGGTATEPALTGSAEMLRGTYDFAGRRFDLVRGRIRFAGEAPVNPQLDIAAEARVRGLSAQIRVTGRSQRPEIAFASTPALPQDELLSRILFGTSITNLSAPEAVQLAAAVASLNDPRGGLDPINALRRSVGLDRLRILPADVTQGIGTQLAAGKYLGRRVYVEVVTDGRGYSATTVEYQITRWLAILSSISTIGRESVNVRVSRDY
ncbi:MAG TPA: translocation/assembly module TamB domain-containing protein [Allosphingosinicella sp.]|nr:translocation/assembly module TamB domain-containing protein [Allosphingosinicella sp.]